MAQSRLKEFPHGFAAAQLLSLHDTHVLYKYHAAANCMISCKTGQTNACSPDVGDPYLRACTPCHQHQPVTLTACRPRQRLHLPPARPAQQTRDTPHCPVSPTSLEQSPQTLSSTIQPTQNCAQHKAMQTTGSCQFAQSKPREANRGFWATSVPC